MNQETNDPNNLKKVDVTTSESIANNINNEKSNPELVKILTTREYWETDGTTLTETPEQLAERVQNWVPYNPDETNSDNFLDRIKAEIRFLVQTNHLKRIKVKQFFLFRGGLDEAYEKFVKIASRGRATNLIEVVEWNIQYWPKHIRYYGISALINYYLRVLDYRRVFQIGIVAITFGAGTTRFFYLEATAKNRTSYVASGKDFYIEPKLENEQSTLVKATFGKHAPFFIDKPILENFSYSDLTELTPRDTFTEPLVEYPFIGEKIENGAQLEYPSLPNYKVYADVTQDELRAMEQALEVTSLYHFKPFVEEGAITSEQARALAVFERPQALPDPDETETSFYNRDYFLEPDEMKNFSPSGISVGTHSNWKTMLPQMQFPNTELEHILPLFENELTNIKPLQLRQVIQDTRLERSLGKFVSATYFDDTDIGDEDETDVDINIENEIKEDFKDELNDYDLIEDSFENDSEDNSHEDVIDDSEENLEESDDSNNNQNNFMINEVETVNTSVETNNNLENNFNGGSVTEGSVNSEFELWEEAYLRMVRPKKNEERMYEVFEQESMEDRTIKSDIDLEYDVNAQVQLKRLEETNTEKNFKDVEAGGNLLFGVFVWYAFYQLYRFRLHFIYSVRKRPEPVLFTRLDHLGRLPGKVHMHEVMGVDGGLESIDKLFAGLQRARGMGIFIPTVLYSVWESAISPLIPSEVDNWLLKQRNNVTTKLLMRNIQKTEFLRPEPSLAESVLLSPQSTNRYEPRFKIVQNTITALNEKFETLDQENSLEISTLENQLTVQRSKISHIKELKSILPFMNFKSLLKIGLKGLALIENELSNTPLVAAVQPGRYGLHNLPKGMLIVGDAGNGRSFLARAIASESRLPFFKTESTRFMDPKFGVMRLMSLFRRVRNEAPGILYIRDIDLITVDRERTNSPELIQLTTQFLICFDGYYIGSEPRPTQRKIFTLGSVSELERMDPACLRSGRFEWIVNLRKPTLGERKFLFLNNASKSPVKVDNNIAWNYFGLMTEGFTNGEVVTIVNNSTLKAIRENTFMHTNESLSEGLSSIFALHENTTVQDTLAGGFFDRLHKDQLENPQSSTYVSPTSTKHLPFRTKCIHLLTSIKDWPKEKPVTNQSVLTMQNIGTSIQPKPLKYSQSLMSGLLDLMAELAFVKQLKRCTPGNSLVAQGTYYGHVALMLNKTLLEIHTCHRFDRFVKPGERASKVIQILGGTNDWQSLNVTTLSDLPKRLKEMRAWYRARPFIERKLDPRFTYDRRRRIPGYRGTVMSSNIEFMREQFEARLRELSHHQRPEYSMLATLRGTYGTRGFQTRLQRPVTGSIVQMNEEMLKLRL